MHGRKRVARDEARDDKEREKAAALASLQKLAFSHIASGTCTEQAVSLSTKLLTLVPDTYTLWRFRETALVPSAETAAMPVSVSAEDASSSPPDRHTNPAFRALLAAELKLTADALQKNPKSYCAWHHREWALWRWRGLADWHAELALCGAALEADERNFHCWNHRRWTVGVAMHCDVPGISLHTELAFTDACIARNFSNFSAWHYRSALLPRIHAPCSAASAAPAAAVRHGADTDADDGHVPLVFDWSRADSGALPSAVLRGELERVRAAAFTEPDDQSAWVYHRWCLDEALRAIRDTIATAGVHAAERAAVLTAVVEDAAQLRELAVVAPTCKWPRLALGHVCRALADEAAGVRSAFARDGDVAAMLSDTARQWVASVRGDGDDDADAVACALRAVAADMLHAASTLDPDRARAYAHMAGDANAV